MGLIKRKYIDLETPITADNLNAIQDAVIALEDGLFSVDNNKSGEVVTITDAAKRAFRSISIYGKTTQNGTPTPDSPVDLVSIGSSGSITVSVTGEDARSMTIATPNGLPGIPVSSGGNYTDANGQQWVCDEIDLARGVLVKRAGMVDMGTLNATLITVAAGNLFRFEVSDIKVSMSSTIMPNILCEAYQTVPTGDRKHSTLSMPVNSRNVDIINNDYTDADTMKASVSGVMLLYELAKPIETPLSAEELAAYAALHTYRGSTVVSNDAGAHMDIEYVMDAKKYIDSLIAGGVVPATVE